MGVSKWLIGTEKVRGRKMYGVYRMKDAALPDTADNREWHGELCSNRRAAENLCWALNNEVISRC